MKINCKSLKLSIIISSIFFAFTIILEVINIKIESDIISFIENIVLGIFCSSIVTIFFYISTYRIEKKKTLEHYWNEIRKILIELKKVDYMNIYFEPDLFIKFINEQKDKLWMENYYKDIGQKVPEEEFENTNYIKNIIANNQKELLEKISIDLKEKYLDERVEIIYNKTIDKINKIINQYLKYIEYSTENLIFILGDIEFFTGEKNYKIAYELFEQIYNLNEKIQESASHFRYYLEREGNVAFVLSEILELQKSIFSVKEKEHSKIIYRKFVDDMEIKLEKFRANVIYSVEPEKFQIIPLMEISKE